ncbi:MAG: I78 family peptidase inhibitor [Rhodoblastus sp.]
MRIITALALSCVLPCLGASAASACDAAKAGFAVGEAFSPALAERARAASGATSVRRIIPGMNYTMEFNPLRLNLYTDEGGKVSNAACG